MRSSRSLPRSCIRAQQAFADLTGAVLAGADLRSADLTGAYLIGANLTDAFLFGAILPLGFAGGGQTDTGADASSPVSPDS